MRVALHIQRNDQQDKRKNILSLVKKYLRYSTKSIVNIYSLLIICTVTVNTITGKEMRPYTARVIVPMTLFGAPVTMDTSSAPPSFFLPI